MNTDQQSAPTAHGLTEKERRFCAEYATTANGAESARRAGYCAGTPKNARVIAARLMKKAGVRALIDRLIAERAERIELDGDQIIADLQRLARWAMLPVPVLDRAGRPTGVDRPLDGAIAVRCLELLGKSMSLWVDRTETVLDQTVELTWSRVAAVETDAEAEPMDDWPADKPLAEVLPAVEVAALESGDDPEQSEQDPEPAERKQGFGGAVL